MTIFIFIYVIGQLLGAIGLAFTQGNSNLSIGNQIIKSLGETSILPGKEEDFRRLFDGTGTDVVGIYQANFVDQFYGTLSNELGIGNFSLNNGIIDHKTFQIFIALVASCIIGWCAVAAIVQLVIRIYDIVFMMLVMPLPLSAYSLDDGERFRLWKKAMISKMFLAYGTIIAVNVYLLIVPIVSKITFSDNLSLSPAGSNVSGKFLLNLFQVFMIVAGGFTISGGQLLFARIMGTDAEEGRQAQQTFRNAVAGIGTATGLAKGAGKLMFGKKDSSSKSSGLSAGDVMATAKNGRFKGVGAGSVFNAMKKAGLAGAGLNIASRLNRKLFGAGSGQWLSSKLKDNKLTRGIKSSGAMATANTMKSMINSQGLIRGLGYSKMAVKHGKEVSMNNAKNRKLAKKNEADRMANYTAEEKHGMKLQAKKDAKKHRKEQKELNFTFIAKSPVKRNNEE